MAEVLSSLSAERPVFEGRTVLRAYLVAWYPTRMSTPTLYVPIPATRMPYDAMRTARAVLVVPPGKALRVAITRAQVGGVRLALRRLGCARRLRSRAHAPGVIDLWLD